jgi:hypothetical protein
VGLPTCIYLVLSGLQVKKVKTLVQGKLKREFLAPFTGEVPISLPFRATCEPEQSELAMEMHER